MTNNMEGLCLVTPSLKRKEKKENIMPYLAYPSFYFCFNSSSFQIPFSDSFPQQIGPSSSAFCPSQEYFSTLLLGLVNNVIPPLNGKFKTGIIGENTSLRPAPNKTQTSSQSGPTPASDVHRAFYQNQDPGTCTQLFLETAVIEILSLPATASQIVSSLV